MSTTKAPHPAYAPLDHAEGRRVTAPNGRVKFLVMGQSDQLPAAFALIGTQAGTKVAMRIGGGCKGMNADDKAAMLEFFAKAFAGFTGVAFSGATRQLGAGNVLDPMVTDVPAHIAHLNPGCVALGTAPRVDLMELVGNGELVLDQYGARPNPGMAAVLIVQNGPDGKSEWNGDVATYFSLMENWRDYGGFTALGLTAWNGGAITEEEVFGAGSRGWPVVLVTGTGRAADDIAAKFRAGDETVRAKFKKPELVYCVSKTEPDALNQWMKQKGFIAD